MADKYIPVGSQFLKVTLCPIMKWVSYRLSVPDVVKVEKTI